MQEIPFYLNGLGRLSFTRCPKVLSDVLPEDTLLHTDCCYVQNRKTSFFKERNQPYQQRMRLSPTGFININPALILHKPGSSSHSDCWPKTFQASRDFSPLLLPVLLEPPSCLPWKSAATRENLRPQSRWLCLMLPQLPLTAPYLLGSINVLSQSPLRLIIIDSLSSLSTADSTEALFIPGSEFRLQVPLVLPS